MENLKNIEINNGHKMPFPAIAITHNGVFHADDIFAFAFLRTINPGIGLIRTSDQEILDKYKDNKEACIFDIGGGEFDHHTKNSYENRRNAKTGEEYYPPIPYSSFGKVVRSYHDYLMTDQEYMQFDSYLCQQIDYQDSFGHMLNYDYMNPIAGLLNLFNPNWDEDGSFQNRFNAFMKCAEFAELIIKRQIKKIKSNNKADDMITSALENVQNKEETVLILDKYCNVSKKLIRSPIEWIVFPSVRGGYQLLSIKNLNNRNKSLIPEEYHETIKEKAKSCTFIHKNGFTATFTNMNEAVDVGHFSTEISRLMSDYSQGTLTQKNFSDQSNTLIEKYLQ